MLAVDPAPYSLQELLDEVGFALVVLLGIHVVVRVGIEPTEYLAHFIASSTAKATVAIWSSADPQPGGQVQPLARESLGYGVVLVIEQPQPVEGRLLVQPEKERSRLDAQAVKTSGQVECGESGVLPDDKAVHPVHASGPGLLTLELEAAHMFECEIASRPDRALSSDDLVNALELCDAESSLNVRQPEVEPELL